MEWIKTLEFSDWISALSFIAVVVGGIFALLQWNKSNIYKRGEIVQKLIKKVRDDEDIAAVMAMIDWDEDFYYDGKFGFKNHSSRSSLHNISEEDLFDKIDKTLSHFSYICYLYFQHTLTKKDMRNFEYELRRLVDNEHISNYLFSLYHWSSSLSVHMSFCFLIDYYFDKKYLDKSFKNPNSKKYEIILPEDYIEEFAEYKR